MRIKTLAILVLLIMVFSTFPVLANGDNSVKKIEFKTHDSGNSSEGYILFNPEFSKNTYLLSKEGEIVHKWRSRYIQGLPVYLLENGSLLRSSFAGRGVNLRFATGGFTGGVEMLDWDGNLIWEYKYSGRNYCLHNDIEPLPNGNILMTVWEHRNHSDALAAGCDPKMLNLFGGILTDAIIEVEPIYPRGGKVVWEWHFWDHLVQDLYPNKANYGIIADYPELLDVNCDRFNRYPSLRFKLRVPLKSSELLHINSIDYNEKFDQILLSSFVLSEIFVIDHNTTSEEAKGHSGGRYGKGGDILYRWGNPCNYRAGTKDDQKLFGQHDPRWIEEGLPGEGHITIFNNGVFRPEEWYSSVEEIIPLVDENGNYYLEPGSAYGPKEPIWNYTADPKSSLFSSQVSGAQRLPNGNTFICSGVQSIFFEVTPEKEIVWKYINDIPFSNSKLKKRFNWVFKTQFYLPDYPGLKYLPKD